MSAQQRDSPFQVASTPGPFVCLAGSAGFDHGHHGQGRELILAPSMYSRKLGSSSLSLTALRTRKKEGGLRWQSLTGWSCYEWRSVMRAGMRPNPQWRRACRFGVGGIAGMARNGIRCRDCPQTLRIHSYTGTPCVPLDLDSHASRRC